MLESIVAGINSGNLDSLMPLYESEAAFAAEPGSLAHGAPGIREALTGFISLKGKLDLEVTRVLEVGDLALVLWVWSFDGTGPDGEPVRLAANNADTRELQPAAADLSDALSEHQPATGKRASRPPAKTRISGSALGNRVNE